MVNDMIRTHMKSFIFGLGILLLLVLPGTTNAGELVIRPFLIDETLEARDIVERDIVLTNTYDTRKLTVYATVNEISVDDTGEIKEFVSPVMTDRTDTVTSWIEMKRGRTDVLPNSTTSVPLTIRTHPQAKPGVYHVFLGFVDTKKAHLAQEAAMAGKADGVILKITVVDNREESLRLSRFGVSRFVLSGDQNATVELQNLGDLPASPAGEIVFYNSNGEEVAAAAVPKTTIAPGESVSIDTPLPVKNSIGRFKANLSLQYGENQSASLFDSTTFYLMPPHLMLLLLLAVLVVGSLLAISLQRALANRNEEEDDEVAMYVREGHEPNPQDHDIDLSHKK